MCVFFVSLLVFAFVIFFRGQGCFKCAKGFFGGLVMPAVRTVTKMPFILVSEYKNPGGLKIVRAEPRRDLFCS